MTRLFLLLLSAVPLVPRPAQAQYIWVNLSFKAVLHPTSGLRPYVFTEADIDATVARMNETLARYERGFRVRRVDPLYDIGGPGQGGTNGPSKWFWPSPRDPYPPNPNIRNQEQMDGEARSNPVSYRWNSNAVNYYVIAGFGLGADAGEASYPSGGYQIVTLGTVDNDLVILHETGHWFELYHTHGSCVRDTNNVCGTAANCGMVGPYFGWRLGDDGIADTLPVQAGDFCFTLQDHLALANFGIGYGACLPEQANQVDDAYFNLMAYGFNRIMDRLTPLQLDKWTRYANNERGFATSGRTRFVSPTGNNASSGLDPTAPKRTVLNAVNASATGGGDIVLLRPGNYNEQITINQPVTLRAAPTNSFPAYARWATIGH